MDRRAECAASDGNRGDFVSRLEGCWLRDPLHRTQSGPARLGRRMTVPSHAIGDFDDVDDRLDALRKRLARGSDVSGTVGTAREARVSPERLSRESSRSSPSARPVRAARATSARRDRGAPSPWTSCHRRPRGRLALHRRGHRRPPRRIEGGTLTTTSTPPRGTRARGRVRVAREVRHRPDLPAPSMGVLAGMGTGAGVRFTTRLAAIRRVIIVVIVTDSRG